MEEQKKSIKSSIKKLIELGKLPEASVLIKEYQKLTIKDAEVYSMEAVIAILEKQFTVAEVILQQGLIIDSNNFDLLYNLAYVYEVQEKFSKAYSLYFKLSKSGDIDKYRDLVLEATQRLQEFSLDNSEQDHSKKKIIFFVKQGLDSFLDDIINGVSDEYETRKVIVTQLGQIDQEMHWADICWFEWCDELVIYASKLDIAKEKKIMCRVHSYEAFTEYPLKVIWNHVDHVIFVAEHIRDLVLETVESLQKEKTSIISNGINLNEYSFKERKPGFNIAYVGYINYKKGPMLLLHAFKAIYEKDRRYKLYIAGQFQDTRYVLYFKQMIEELGLVNNVIFEGWQDNLDQWLENKNYILCTSVLESQNMSVMQAMSKGIKPLVHNFVGAKKIYPKEYIWNSIDQVVMMVQNSKAYESMQYHSYIKEKYLFNNKIKEIKQLTNSVLN
jgi:glycosyltransferase involved in cell wall biosynthesis